MKYLVLDANIVIDYVKADKTLFSLVSQYVGEVCFVDEMLKEVDQIQGRDEASELGINLVLAEKTEEQEAERRAADSSLSSFDWLCFFVAKRLGYCCVTNDKGLINHCRSEGVETIRGGRLIIELCRNGGVTKERAKEIALGITKANKWTDGAWLRAFNKEIDAL